MEHCAVEYEFLKDRPYWLALYRSRMTTDHCVDFDAKDYELACYRHKGIVEPVVCPILEHFQNLKRVYDHFPRRIWCISSRTLGLHAWKKHQLRPTLEVHDETKLLLSEIGLGDVEVHPMAGRCFRRPFGRDYLIITPETTLTDWRDQVTYYEDDARTAPFDRIVEAMLGRIDDSIRRYYRADKCLTKLRLSVVEERLDGIRRWRDAGFKEKVAAAGCTLAPAPAAEPTVSGGIDRTDSGTADHRDLTNRATERQDKWPLWVERMATTGLVAEDTVGHVVHEMAKWLYWVEMFDLPEIDRTNRIEELLNHFVLKKHNGFVTRINKGTVRNVLSQVRSAVASASRIERPESLELFERLRNSRGQGKYWRPIYIVPTLDGSTEVGNTPSTFSSLTSYMFINKGSVNQPSLEATQEADLERDLHLPLSGTSESSQVFLPPILEDQVDQIARDNRMRKRNGEYPLARFARRLLNTLWEQGGTARLNNELLIEMVGTSNPNQQVSYRRLLQDGGLIVEGSGESDYLRQTWDLLQGSFPDNLSSETFPRSKSNYQPRAFSKSYRLSQVARDAFEDHHQKGHQLVVDEATSHRQMEGLVPTN